MIKLFEKKSDCCGCTACYGVCPKSAITMQEDDEGFVYPAIDPAACVQCKKCETVCPLKTPREENEPLRLMGAKNTDEDVRKNSSSGGVFSLLAGYVQAQNGVIYGAAYDESFAVRHMRAEGEDWKAFCVSKYVQSHMDDVFSLVRKDLTDGKTVLFSGTPCQVDGLQRYLRNVKVDTAKLITCDIVCHGTPSPKIWQAYLRYVEKTGKVKVGAVSFRNKDEVGWHGSTLTVWDEKGSVILSEDQVQNYYFQLFSCGYSLRPACHSCRYANTHRPGDITLGDFWGIEKHFPERDDNKGISLVMINTPTGHHLWDEISQNTVWFEAEKEQCLQSNLRQPSEPSPNRADFWQQYQKFGLPYMGQVMGYFPKNKWNTLRVRMICYLEKIRKLLGK